MGANICEREQTVLDFFGACDVFEVQTAVGTDERLYWGCELSCCAGRDSGLWSFSQRIRKYDADCGENGDLVFHFSVSSSDNVSVILPFKEKVNA